MVFQFISHKLQQLSQSFPPQPEFTEEHLTDLKDKVSSDFIVIQ